MHKFLARGLLIATAALVASGTASADPERKRFCSESLVRGTYAGQLSGKQTMPDGSCRNSSASSSGSMTATAAWSSRTA